MSDGHHRRVFRQAAGFFVATVALVKAGQWDGPGLGQWSVRDLTGHASRALLTVETYLGQPAAGVDVVGPVEYFVRALASIGDSEQVARRGREAGAALGDDPARSVREIAERVLRMVSEADDDRLVATPVGGMRLVDYLPTRSFELVVHTLDLAGAIGVDAEPPAEALAASSMLATELALRSGRGADVLLGLTGRRPLPTGFSVV